MVDQLRKAKRSGTIHLHTGIVWKNSFKELWITTEAGRVIRPIYYAPAIREIAADKSGALKHHIQQLQDWNSLLLWETPRGEKLIEYIGNSTLVGHRINFDVEMINEVLEKMACGRLKNEALEQE